MPRRTACLKGRVLWGQTQSGYKAVGARCKIGWGAVPGGWKHGWGGGGGIGVADVPSGRVEGGALGGTPPPFKQSPGVPLEAGCACGRV